MAYHMARIWPERIEKVIIASSGVNMRRKDNEAMLKRANVEKIDEFLLPVTAEQLRTLMKLAVFKGGGRKMPDFFFNDFIHVRTKLVTSFFLILNSLIKFHFISQIFF